MPGPTPRYWELAPGLNNVGSYQVSGKPFVSGGATAGNAAAVKFPAVSRWVYVVNPKATALRVGFSEIGISDLNFLRCTVEHPLSCPVAYQSMHATFHFKNRTVVFKIQMVREQHFKMFEICIWNTNVSRTFF